MRPTVVHLELHTRDAPGAQAFYGGLCGWRPERIHAGGGSYLTLDIGRNIGGGIVESGAPGPLWLPYVAVCDIEATTQRARECGADVVLEPREGPAGWRSIVAAPAAGQIAFFQAKR